MISRMLLRCCLPLFILATASQAVAEMDKVLIHSDGFREGLSNWVIEQTPGGKVYTSDGSLVIEDNGGCTVWFKEPLEAPVMITYDAVMSSDARVSDLNCFWMASDPRNPEYLFWRGHGRDGSFASYDALQTYYVGYGGNYNSTTRFRRYEGGGVKPLLPGHDLGEAPFLLEGGKTYRIELIAANGRAIYKRNGETIFDYQDPKPLTRGWFGFRTVLSKMEIRDFRVWRLEEKAEF